MFGGVENFNAVCERVVTDLTTLPALLDELKHSIESSASAQLLLDLGYAGGLHGIDLQKMAKGGVGDEKNRVLELVLVVGARLPGRECLELKQQFRPYVGSTRANQQIMRNGRTGKLAWTKNVDTSSEERRVIRLLAPLDRKSVRTMPNRSESRPCSEESTECKGMYKLHGWGGAAAVSCGLPNRNPAPLHKSRSALHETQIIV